MKTGEELWLNIYQNSYWHIDKIIKQVRNNHTKEIESLQKGGWKE